jgi:hypothetical protein
MRYIILLIGCSFLFTGCFTMSAIDRAKQDRMPERVKTVLTSYKDTSGNAVIVYKKHYRTAVYKAVVPLDSIITLYKAAEKDDLRNSDSTLANFEGVFTVQDARNKKEKQRVVLFNNETPLTDTTGLSKEIAKNEHKNELKQRLPALLLQPRITKRFLLRFSHAGIKISGTCWCHLP